MDTAKSSTRLVGAALGALALVIVTGPAAPAAAQVHLGPQISLGGDTDVGIGGRVVAGMPDYSGLEFVGSFDVFFPDNDHLDYWEINGNLVHNFEVPEASAIRPYAGGGVNIARFDRDPRIGGTDDRDDTDVGLNLLGGMKFPMENVAPYVELRLEVEGGDQFVVTGGLLFP